MSNGSGELGGQGQLDDLEEDKDSRCDESVGLTSPTGVSEPIVKKRRVDLNREGQFTPAWASATSSASAIGETPSVVAVPYLTPQATMMSTNGGSLPQSQSTPISRSRRSLDQVRENHGPHGHWDWGQS